MSTLCDAGDEMTTITLTVEYECTDRYLRGGGHIIEVQVDDHPPRSPRGGFTNADEAGRWLENNGFAFKPAASTWVDRRGTTFRRTRKQVFQKKRKEQSDEQGSSN
jgi:hypothetical protein